MKNIYSELDPIVTIDYAVGLVDGNQAELARKLKVSRATVSDWKRAGEILPPLHAHRFVKIFGEPRATA